MSNNSLLLIDPKFRTDDSARCNLLLKITNNSFSYAVVNNQTGDINLIFDKQNCHDIETELKNAFNTDSYLSMPYSAVKASVQTPNSIFIPDEWFDADDLSVYSKYLGAANKVYAKANKIGFKTVFCFDQFIEEQLPNEAIILPQSTTLITLINHLPENTLLIDFTATAFSVLYIKGGKIIFQNHFSAETVDEFNYYMLYIIKELNLDDSIPVYLQGIIDEDDDHYNCLLKYFNQLYFFHLEKHKKSELLADMPTHYFNDLLAIDLCE